MTNRRSLDQAHPPHKRQAGLRATVVGVVLWVSACATTADIQARREEAAAQLEQEADALFVALESAALEHDVPVARRDPARRRLTSDWLDEDPRTRRRYFLSVLLHPAGLALRAHIARETAAVGEDGSATWRELPPEEAVTAEENAIIQRAYEIWSEAR